MKFNEFARAPADKPGGGGKGHEKFRTYEVSRLSMTLADHERVGSTFGESDELSMLRQHPGKTYAEIIGDDALRALMLRQKDMVTEQYQNMRSDFTSENIRAFEVAIRTFEADVNYLRKIGKLPPELASFKAKKDFPME